MAIVVAIKWMQLLRLHNAGFTVRVVNFSCLKSFSKLLLCATEIIHPTVEYFLVRATQKKLVAFPYSPKNMFRLTDYSQ